MTTAAAELEQGRRFSEQHAWADAYESLAAADRASELSADDLELLATAAYMLGRDDEYARTLERTHNLLVEAGDAAGAARTAFWLGLTLLLAGQAAPANGWFGRAERLLEDADADCAIRGYLLFPVQMRQTAEGDHQAAHDTAAEAATIGERCGDADLVALAVQEQGHALVRLGRAEEGLRLLDEIMLRVISGSLSPIVTGLIYCNTISFCQDVRELRRAREWTAALTGWCEEQPEMVAHTGACLVHRAEIMELAGDWADALDEARRAHERLTGTGTMQALAGYAVYRVGEVHRLRGELGSAEDAYRRSAALGCEPQPGLALLRLAQGQHQAAAAAIRRALAEASESFDRASLLPAQVEIMLAAGDLRGARKGSVELSEIAGRHQATVLDAASAYAKGSVDVADDEPRPALSALRRSFHLWQELDVPYEAARSRLLIGLACRALGDDDSAELELDAARTAFVELGAVTDIARLDALAGTAPDEDHGLTHRELEVLRLVAAGDSNREIAAALVISEHTVARHVQNIFAKLGVSSRTAASAFAFEHDLL